MNENTFSVSKLNIIKLWLKGFAALFFGCTIMMARSYMLNGNTITFSTLWILLFCLLTYFLFRNFFKNFNLFGFFLIPIFIGSLVGAFTFSLLPQEYQFPINPRYVGISKYDKMESDSEGNVYQEHGLYRITDEDVQNDLSAYEERNELVKPEYFLFWQTGYDQSYEPIDIESYREPEDTLDKFELYLTIGPVLLFEICINSLYRYLLPSLLILLILQYVGRIKYKSDKSFWIPYYYDLLENKK